MLVVRRLETFVTVDSLLERIFDEILRRTGVRETCDWQLRDWRHPKRLEGRLELAIIKNCSLFEKCSFSFHSFFTKCVYTRLICG